MQNFLYLYISYFSLRNHILCVLSIRLYWVVLSIPRRVLCMLTQNIHTHKCINLHNTHTWVFLDLMFLCTISKAEEQMIKLHRLTVVGEMKKVKYNINISFFFPLVPHFSRPPHVSVLLCEREEQGMSSRSWLALPIITFIVRDTAAWNADFKEY